MHLLMHSVYHDFAHVTSTACGCSYHLCDMSSHANGSAHLFTRQPLGSSPQTRTVVLPVADLIVISARTVVLPVVDIIVSARTDVLR